jgi:lathosterol oxidase
MERWMEFRDEVSDRLYPTPQWRFGQGRISGTLSLALGTLALFAVLCFHFPALLTTPELRAIYPMPVVVVLVKSTLALALALGALSVWLRGAPWIGFAGLGISGLAVALGGFHVEPTGPVLESPHASLDWFVLDLLVLALIFVPLERLRALRPEQSIFRSGWKTDLSYFFVNHLLLQMIAFTTMAPAMLLLGIALGSPLQSAVAAQPLIVQFVEILLVADLAQYAVHRIFHRVPFLWRYHAVHHSSEAMDWLAGSRLHLLDIVVVRAASFAPIFAFGFGEAAVRAYLVFVSFQAVLNHANVAWELRRLSHWIVTPHFHHWHHATPDEACDKNFAAHLPVLDRLFGTHHLPNGSWPDRYGAPDDPQPIGYLAQLIAPLRP